MKKLFLVGFTSLFIMTSCSSDDDSSNNSNESGTPKIEGSLTPEEGKKQLEDNAIQLLNKIEDFENDSALNEIIELAEFLSADNSSPKHLNGFQLTAVNSIINLSNAKNSVLDTALNQTTAVETTTLEDFNNEKGVYTWNPALKGGEGDFEKTGNSDDIIYNIAFNGKNAVFTVSEFDMTFAKDDAEVPTKAVAQLNIGSTTVFSQNYTASIDTGKTVPNNFSNTTKIGAFSLVTEYSNSNNQSLTQSFQFKIGNDVIAGYNYTTEGNFNEVENDSAEFTDVLDNATVSLQFLNATLVTKANDDNVNPESELTIDEVIELLNNNINSELIINNKSIAKNQFYKDQEEFPVFNFDPNTGDLNETTETEDIINARFLFEDGTTADFDTYFDNSFSNTEDKFESVFDVYTNLFEDINFNSGDDNKEISINTEPAVF